jgi:hypothetical protein
VVAVSPTVILLLSTVGAVGAMRLAVSSPSAVAKVPAATSAAPATSIARIFLDCCMGVASLSVTRPRMACGYAESLLPTWTVAG